MADASGQTIARNTFFLTLAYSAQKILSFAYYAFLARNIRPPELLGEYTFALAFASLFVIFMDFGLGPILTREVARKREELPEQLEHILGIKMILMLLSLLTMYGVFFLVRLGEPLPQEAVNLVYLASLVNVLDTLTFTFFSIFRGMQNLKYEAIGIIVYQILIVGVGMVCIGVFHKPVTFAMAAILVGSLFHFLFSSFLVFRRLHLSPNLHFSPARAKQLLTIAAPFALAGIFFKLNGSIDTVMLRLLVSSRGVAWYSIAFKLTTALTVLPGAFATSYFPAMSQAWKSHRERLPDLFERSMIYIMLLSLPIAVGVFVIAEPLIISIYEEIFRPSILPLQIFMISLFFVFINYPVGNFLNAVDRQSRNTVHMGIALLVNVVLNFILIPRYTFIGATISAVISSVVLVSLGLPVVYRVAPFNLRLLADRFFRGLFSSAIMGIVLFFLRSSVPLAGLLLLGLFLYPALLLFTRATTIQELLLLRNAFLKKGEAL